MKLKFINSLLFILPLFFIACQSSPSPSDEGETTAEEMPEWEREHQLFKAGYADSVNTGLLEDTFKGSSRREAKNTIGELDVTINYGSPGKRGRVIWNGLVSYDQVWVAGSHWATAITFSKDVVIEDTRIPADMYALFIVPGREQWEMIINSRFDQHLADDYTEEEDLLKVTVDPIILEEAVERLTYSIKNNEDGTGSIVFAWDQIQLELPFAAAAE